MTHYPSFAEIEKIEAQARLMRAAYIRALFVGLFSRKAPMGAQIPAAT